MIRKHRKPVDDGFSPEGWMSFSDITTGLLFIFLLITMTMMYLAREDQREYRELQQKEAELQKKYREILAREEQLRHHVEEVNQKISSSREQTLAVMDRVVSALDRHGITVSADRSNYVIHIRDSQLKFESGEYSVPAGYRQNVRTMAKVLYQILGEDADSQMRIGYLDTVFIEGHTDSMVYNRPEIFGNWGLSALRAISVWNFMIGDESGEDLEKFRNSDGRPLFSVSGYADTRPNPCAEETGSGDVCPGGEDADSDPHARNRRIDIRFFPHMEEITVYSDRTVLQQQQ